MAITLTYGSLSITIDEPDFPYTYAWSKKQTVLESEQGKRYVYDFGAQRRKWDLKWNLMSSSDFLQLENFVTNTINFKEKPFTFTDHNGDSFQVRCMSFGHSQVNPDYYSVSLVLEEEL